MSVVPARHAAPAVERPRHIALVKKLAAAVAATMLAVGTFAVTTAATAASATDFPDFQAACQVLDLTVPTGIVNGSARQNGIDNNLNTFVGGQLVVGAAASEMEGVTVVAGDMQVNKTGWFGVGTVGAGSLISPDTGKDVLLVGGDVLGALSIDLSDGLGRIGGDGSSGFPGWFTGYADNLGADALKTDNYSPAYDFGGFAATITTYSAELASQGVAATASVVGGVLQLDGGNVNGVLRFDVPAADLAAVTQVSLTNIRSTQPLVINVTGTGSVGFAALPFNVTYSDVPGDHVGGTGAFPWNLNTYEYTGYASRIMWNFQHTPDITLTTGEQWVGSILAPQADLVASQSINGRVYVGGDFTFDGQGNEVHAFGWFGCASAPAAGATGTFTIAKALTGTQAASVPGTTPFTVNYTVNGTPAATPLTILANGSVENGPVLDEGDVVVFSEATPPAVGGVTWGAATIRVNGTVTDTLTISDGGNATVVVTNTANTSVVIPDNATFDVSKTVAGAAAGLVDSTVHFTVDWSVTAGPSVGSSGTIVLNTVGVVSGGHPALKVGDVIAFTEQTPPAVVGVTWGPTPSIPDLTLTTAGNSASFTVTNLANVPVGPAQGTFTLAKALTGPQAARVPAGTTFTVNYTVNGVPAAAPLVIPATGSSVNGPVLEVGDVVVFSEATPPAVTGVVWGPVSIGVNGTVTSSLTITDGGNASVVVTNTANTPARVSVGDFVWIDRDGNGVQGGSDPGISGVTLRISQTNGAPVRDVFGVLVANQVTATHGYYRFENLPVLPAGQHYIVTVDTVASATALAPYVPTLAGSTSRELDSETWVAESTDLTVDGAHDGSLDFGFVLADDSLATTGAGPLAPMLGAALALIMVGLASVLVVRRRMHT